MSLRRLYKWQHEAVLPYSPMRKPRGILSVYCARVSSSSDSIIPPHTVRQTLNASLSPFNAATWITAWRLFTSCITWSACVRSAGTLGSADAAIKVWSRPKGATKPWFWTFTITPRHAFRTVYSIENNIPKKNSRKIIKFNRFLQHH